MTSTETTEIHPSWFEHPLVAGAIERSHGDPLVVLQNVHDGLRWLDVNAKGKTFSETLIERRVQDSVELFRERLEREGLTPAEISAIVDYEAPRLAPLQQMPLKKRMEIRQRIAFLHGSGWPARVIAAHMGMSSDSVRDQINSAGVGKVLTDRQSEIAQAALGSSNTAAAKHYGVALSSVSRWRQCYQAQAEAAEVA